MFPVLGICGGMQVMNVALGGSLFQDIPSQVTNPLQHRQPTHATTLSHSVAVAPNTLLQRIVHTAVLQVNSSHHQSVKHVASSLVASAASADGIVEAVESPAQRFFLGIQWHPEFLFDRYPLHRRLFDAFLRGRSDELANSTVNDSRDVHGLITESRWISWMVDRLRHLTFS